MIKGFWTSKRLEAVSKISLNLSQAFLIAAVIGGVFDKIHSFWIKLLFGLSILFLLIMGIIFSDKSDKEK